MDLNSSRGWDPLFLIIRSGDEIAGIAPLMMKTKLGTRIARFILEPYYTPDLVIKDRFRAEALAEILDYLFQTLKCKLVDLSLPGETENLYVLEKKCEAKHIHFSVEPCTGHRILPVEDNWERFVSVRGGRFRRRFRKMERKLNEAGSLRVSCFDGNQNESHAFDRIVAIERSSWKEAWRTHRMQTMDPELPIVWKCTGCAAETTQGFERATWFLELNDHPLAYAIILRYKQIALIVKTSYDLRYRNLYPGMYLINAVVQALFNDGSVRHIDYLTDMPFMGAWTKLCRPRVRVLMGKGVLLTGMICLYLNSEIRKIMTTMLNWSRKIPFTYAPC